MIVVRLTGLTSWTSSLLYTFASARQVLQERCSCAIGCIGTPLWTCLCHNLCSFHEVYTMGCHCLDNQHSHVVSRMSSTSFI